MKKKVSKILIFLAGITVLSMLFAFSASAKTVKSGYFVYAVGSKSAMVTKYTGKQKTVTIPSKISGVPVTTIGNEAFADNKSIVTVNIPSKVTTIGKYAFSCCSSLTTVNFPASLKVIGTAAFDSCKSLNKISIPSKVTTVGSSAFWYCTSLKAVVIRPAVTAIGKNAFTGCKNLTAYVYPGTTGEKYIKAIKTVKLVYRYVNSIKLNTSAVSVVLGATSKLSYKVSPTPVYSSAVKYSSSNNKIATVTSAGTIKAISCGAAKITCTAADGSKKSASCSVTVVPAKLGQVYQTGTTATGFNLRWPQVPGATAYRVYVYNATTKKWSVLGNTTKLYYKVTGLPLGSSIAYRVRAYTTVSKKNYYGALCATYVGKTLVPASVSTVTAQSTSSTVTLSWAAAKNATNYFVYSYNAATKVSTRIGSASSNSYINLHLNANTEYRYFVRAVIKDGDKYLYSDKNSSVIVINTLPEKVSGFSIDSDSVYFDRMTLKWNPMPNVSGYTVTVSDSQGNFQKEVVADAQSTTSAEIKDLVSGTEYSFKIRAYTVNGAKTYYSDYSDSISGETTFIPSTPTEAFDRFIVAYNNSKNSTSSFTLVSITDVSDVVDNGNDDCKNFLSSIAKNEEEFFNIIQGADQATSTNVNDILAPSGLNSTLSIDDVVAETLSNGEINGSGYEVSFSLNGENDSSAIHDKILPIVDFSSIVSENEGAVLNSYAFGSMGVTAKVRGDISNDKELLESLTVTCPVTINFSVGEDTFEASQTVSYTYLFSW